MPYDSQSDSRKNFVPRFLPWLLGGVMLVVYWTTLNHWVTLLNIGQVATISGWTWQPQLFSPLTFLVTLPFRWLPTAHIPAALNVFAALCAAATLTVLARSVAILPHDRTEMERMRERSDFSFLTGWVAWLPPVAAVSFAGLQLGFWENATSFTGESFQLLWFAVILGQLLEYRLDEREGRLYLAAFLYGAGLTENWAMVGFIPLFLVMIIWLRGFSFFSLHFLSRMTWSGLAGLLLLFLLPLTAKLSGSYPMTFWEELKPNLHADWDIIHLFWKRQDVRHDLALISLTSLLPAFVMALRWSSSFGDSSRIGATLVHYLMHVVNAVLLGALVWVTFDPPFSPRQLLLDMGMPAPALTFYYVVALCIGYYSGYFLLVFGKAAIPSRRNPRPDPALPKVLAWLCPVITVGVLASLVIGAGLLMYKNGPVVRTFNGDSLLKYAQFTVQNLPRDGAILLSDSDDPTRDQPVRAYLVQAVLARDGRTQNYPVVDTQALNWPVYHDYLHKRYPKTWPQTVTTNDVSALSLARIFVLLHQLSQSNNLCYLHPSFGYYFEQFYQEPHGLVYTLKTLPGNDVLPPPFNKNLIAENESFWTQALTSARPAIEKAQHPTDLTKEGGAIGWFMKHLHVSPEGDPSALLAGAYYSRNLNALGVEVQRAGELDKAAMLFSNACELNSNNVVASINLAFNKTLRTGTPATLNLSGTITDQLGKYRSLNEALAANGPFDETSFCFVNGAQFMQSLPPLMHQAAVLFNRVHQLFPDNLAARLFLAQIYVFFHQPDKAMEELREPLAKPHLFALNEYNSTELNVLAAAAHFQKHEDADGAALLEQEMSRHPDDEMLQQVSTQVFNMRGLYTNALQVINRKLARTPNDPNWLFAKGFDSLQIGAYDDAITNLNRFLEFQTNNPDALYNCGVAYFKSDQLEAARADFLKLQAIYTNNLRVAYCLGDIAWHQHDTNEAIRNYKILLTYAPTNVPELKTVREHLAQLDGK